MKYRNNFPEQIRIESVSEMQKTHIFDFVFV